MVGFTGIFGVGPESGCSYVRKKWKPVERLRD